MSERKRKQGKKENIEMQFREVISGHSTLDVLEDYIKQVLGKYPDYSLKQMQLIVNSEKNGLYFVAVANEGDQVSKLPGREEKLPFHLEIVNQDYGTMKKYFEDRWTNFQENFERLEKTGFLLQTD